jgi:hypothetical protein
VSAARTPAFRKVEEAFAGASPAQPSPHRPASQRASGGSSPQLFTTLYTSRAVWSATV